MLTTVFKSYTYTQYSDDENISAFFGAYNKLAQQIYEWVLTANLPIFIGGYNSSDQLYWIAHGIYGQTPPSMVSSKSLSFGPYNTIKYNQLAYNKRKKISENSQIVASDDVFKRIMTWNFYKGDGMGFSVGWLKRRVRRFLEGDQGTDIANDQQFGISVTFDGSGGVAIKLSAASETAGFINLAFASILSSAFDNNLLHMPFWADVTVTVV